MIQLQIVGEIDSVVRNKCIKLFDHTLLCLERHILYKGNLFVLSNLLWQKYDIETGLKSCYEKFVTKIYRMAIHTFKNIVNNYKN